MAIRTNIFSPPFFKPIALDTMTGWPVAPLTQPQKVVSTATESTRGETVLATAKFLVPPSVGDQITDAAALANDGSSWADVALPHSWNAFDATGFEADGVDAAIRAAASG